MISFHGDYTVLIPFGLESHDAQRMLMSEFDLPYKALSHADFESVREKLALVARSIGQPIPKRSYCSLQPPSMATSPSQQVSVLSFFFP
ncbi:probable DNA primase large subunit [Aristolochia californica]|uniref:probable DNA primase large subunit n=1 Tax=Aristolochia californica TaxID=171875 RepID=UPI0035E19577